MHPGTQNRISRHFFGGSISIADHKRQSPHRLPAVRALQKTSSGFGLDCSLPSVCNAARYRW